MWAGPDQQFFPNVGSGVPVFFFPLWTRLLRLPAPGGIFTGVFSPVFSSLTSPSPPPFFFLPDRHDDYDLTGFRVSTPGPSELGCSLSFGLFRTSLSLCPRAPPKSQPSLPVLGRVSSVDRQPTPFSQVWVCLFFSFLFVGPPSATPLLLKPVAPSPLYELSIGDGQFFFFGVFLVVLVPFTSPSFTDCRVCFFFPPPGF